MEGGEQVIPMIEKDRIEGCDARKRHLDCSGDRSKTGENMWGVTVGLLKVWKEHHLGWNRMEVDDRGIESSEVTKNGFVEELGKKASDWEVINDGVAVERKSGGDNWGKTCKMSKSGSALHMHREGLEGGVHTPVI
jgi:hypothetical protein